MEILNSKVVRRYKSGYEIREEDWKSGRSDITKMRQAYTPSGDYIGDTKTAHYLCTKRGIRPERANSSHCGCSIGFCEKEQKWYGWSHRAIYGFGIGSTVTEGHCAFTPEKGTWTATNLEEAKQIAIDFAAGVS